MTTREAKAIISYNIINRNINSPVEWVDEESIDVLSPIFGEYYTINHKEQKSDSDYEIISVLSRILRRECLSMWIEDFYYSLITF